MLCSHEEKRASAVSSQGVSLKWVWQDPGYEDPEPVLGTTVDCQSRLHLFVTHEPWRLESQDYLERCWFEGNGTNTVERVV